jgi:hypothetical protein
MADDNVFDWVCGALESATSLDRLEARGTLRLALKASGLEARTVTAEQLQAVILRVLPAELEARGVADATSVCQTLARDLDHQGFRAAGGDSPENIFARLGGG